MLDKSKEFFHNLPNTLTLAFEDGIILDTNKNKVIYSNLAWDLLRAYPLTPITVNHFVDQVLKGRRLTSNTHIQLMENIYKDIVTVYGLDTPDKIDDLLKLVEHVNANIYNETSLLSEPDVSSIDILDFIQVTKYKPIDDIVESTVATDESIAYCYDRVTEILNKDSSLSENSIVKAVRADLVSIGQVLQCVAIRGKVTEVDGQYIPRPILSNFTKGLNKLWQYAGESRSAAKSLYFSDAKLQDAEYTARRIQLLCMVVTNIDYSDCGSTRYMEWRVMPPIKDENGITTYKGDLAFMHGKYYLDETTNALKCITHDDPALYGKVLKIRTVLYCKHSDPHKVCEVCFGLLSKNVSRISNLGHLCAATMTQQITQSVLSIKHLDYNQGGSVIQLNETLSRFFITDRQRISYILQESWKNKNIKLVVNRDEAIGLIDILNIDDIKDISPLRISQIEYIDIVYYEGDEEKSLIVQLGQGNKRVVLTTEFLIYLKTHQWDTDHRGNFIFDLKDWNFKLPIFKLPETEYSYSDHSVLISKVIESNMKNISDRSKPHSPVATLQELFNLVNTKINVNIAALEVIIYASMIPEKGSFAMGRCENPVLGVSAMLIKNRSLATAYGYQDIYKTMINPRNFFKLDRPDSMFDIIFTPNEYLDHRQ